jgi:hypothetical protein
VAEWQHVQPASFGATPHYARSTVSLSVFETVLAGLPAKLLTRTISEIG